MRRRRRRCQPPWTTLGLIGPLCLLGVTTSGCTSKTDPSVVGHGLPDTSSGRTAPMPTLPRCELNQIVQYPDSDTPEWVVGELFGAALSEAPEEKAYKRFAPLFSSVHRRAWIREAYWTAARKHVRTYVSDGSTEDEVVFTVCRRVEESGKKLKLFIGSRDPARSNMPITLAPNDAGHWKVLAYAP